MPGPPEPASRPVPDGPPAGPTRPEAARPGLRVLRNRDFSVLLLGQFVSNTGVWMHNVTVPFVLFAATGSPAWVGFGGFAQFLPAMLAAPLGGILADRLSRRILLGVCSALQLVVSLTLAVVWRGGDGDPWATVGLVAVLGLLSGTALPAWQSMVPMVVPRSDLVPAVSLNSTVFNAARAFGPALGGVVLGVFGPATAFAANGLSYLGVLAAVGLVAVPRTKPGGGPSRGRAAFAAGLAHAARRPGVRLAWGLAFCGAALGAPVMGLAAVMAADEFGVGEGRYGLLTAAVGAGAVVGGLLVTAFGHRAERSRLAAPAIGLYGGAVLAFALSPGYAAGLVAMFAVGAGLLATNTTLNTSIQLKVDDAFRGRVMSVWAMAITGGLPLGSLAQGWAAARVGVRPTIAAAGGLLVCVVVVGRLSGALAALDPGRRRGDDGVAGATVPARPVGS